MFNEKVKVIPTGHDLNFLTVETFQEVFFDVFEITINGSTFIAEKVSEYKGMPVVIIPITHLNKKYDASFVLKEGAFEVLFNPKTLTYTGEVPAEAVVVEEIIQDIIECKDTSIDDFIIEKRDDIINDINQAKLSATKYAEAIKQQKISEASLDIEAKQVRIKNEIAELKQDLLNEFYSLTENVRTDLNESNKLERNNVLDFINNSLTKLSDKLISDVKSHRTDAITLFDEKIAQLANNILKVNLLKEIELKQVSNLQSIDEKFKAVTEVLNTFILKEQSQVVETVTNIVNTKLEEYDATLITLEKVNVEINESVRNLNTFFNDNINTVSTKLTNEINESKNTLDTLISSRIDVATSNIHDFYDSKIQLIEANVTDITAAQKQEFISLINESKQSLLAQIAEIKIESKQVLIEQLGSKPIDLKGVKKDLEKDITARFTNELVNLKRYIELSSGGGSVAQQFANGGTMNGNLVVTGTLSASQYLGITQGGLGADYLPLSGGTVNGNLTVVGTLCATLLEALSANITVLDIKQYELSGFNVKGNATVQGTVSASGNLLTSSSVGIGTSTPTTKLEVVGSIGKFNVSDEGYTTSMTRSNSNLGLYAGYNLGIISFGGTADGYTTQQIGAQINSLTEGTGVETWQLRPAANLLFHTTPNLSGGVLTERMRITGAGNVGIGTSTPTAKLDVVDTTLAGSGGLSGSVLNLSQTWNTSGGPTAVKINITDIASGSVSNSRLLDIVYNGTSYLNIIKDGQARFAGLITVHGLLNNSTTYLRMPLPVITFGNADQTSLRLEDTHVFALRGTINAQTFRIYNTYTDPTNFERLNIKWDTNILKLGTEKGSAGGAARPMEFQTDGTTRMTITSAGRVGIGLTNPSLYDLTIQNAVTSAYSYSSIGILKHSSSTTDGRSVLTFSGDFGNSFRISQNGYTTAGTNTPNHAAFLELFNQNGMFIGTGQAPDLYAQFSTAIEKRFSIYSALNSSLTNYERLSFKPQLTGSFLIMSEALGTGAYRNIEIQNGGSTRMTITSAGNIGIGTITPNERLTVVGNISAAGDIAVATSLQGVILVAPNSTRWKITVNNDGTLSTTAL